jgi:hypothetical protein
MIKKRKFTKSHEPPPIKISNTGNEFGGLDCIALFLKLRIKAYKDGMLLY